MVILNFTRIFKSYKESKKIYITFKKIPEIDSSVHINLILQDYFMQRLTQSRTVPNGYPEPNGYPCDTDPKRYPDVG